MKNNLVKHILTAAISLSFGAAAATVDSPWCTINSPEQIAADSVIEVEITLKNDAPAGLKIGGDLHFSNDKGAYLGFAAWGGEPKPLEPGRKATFRYRIPKLKEGVSTVFAQFFLTPATWKEKVKEHRSAPIRLTSTAPQSAPAAETAAAETAVRKKEGSWCTIETPAQVAKDGTFNVKLTLKKDIPAGMKVGGDIHLKNSDTGAYVGYGAWGGATKTATPGEMLTFTYRVPALKSGANAVFIHYYLSPSTLLSKIFIL
ncbi:cupredoxin domain-containing protein [Victivallis vadensis]|uniref:Uncharacterized protein n=1 Tax=Victivallis vadensis TaxID=172901 RepID=A0A2U1A996_9BACT|nr:hypothetical protein [Victivallis vadensis]PVY29761.1 hypothetical protein C8D82_1676 [Victivallis vadensis]